jgi:lipopolysaccharide export system permease protein
MKLLWTLTVNFLPLGLPLAFLLGILFAFSRLSGDSEIVAMKSGGMSLSSISKPVFALSILVSILSFLLNMNWTPWSEIASRQTLAKIGNRRFISAINEGTFSSSFFNLVMFTERVNNRIGKLEKVFIFDEKNTKAPLSVVAKKGELIRVQSNADDIGGVVLQLQDGSIHQSDMAKNSYSLANFDTYQVFFDVPGPGKVGGLRPKMMGFSELKAKRARSDIQEQEIRELDTELWRRITVAIVPILFVFMGIGFGVVKTRGKRANAMLVAFVTMALYWQIQVSSIWLGESGALPPWLAMQIPNFLVLMIGWYKFKRAAW